MNRELRKKWKEVEALLLEARGLFQIPETGEDGYNEERFQEYIAHNELGLALEELEGMPLYNETPREFWQLLLKAANRMELKDKIHEFTKTIACYP